MRSSSRNRQLTALAASLVALYGTAGSVQAIEIETGNPDLQVRWGNTVRVNLGVRAESRDPAIASSPSTDEGDMAYDRGDLVNGRVDLLSELDVAWAAKYGFRVSGSAWYDGAFNKTVHTAPGLENRGSYFGNRYSNHTKRFHEGPSGEILDAYVFGNFDLGGMPLTVKAGRQTNLWGEAVVLSTHSVSYAQAPVDGLKAVASPGADAKEVSLPVGQIYASLQLTDRLSLAAQYYYEWKPTRLAEGGTYLAGTDFLLRGPDKFSLAPGVDLLNQRLVEPKKRGDWGVAARYNVEAIGATVGAYYRVFDERSPTVSLNVANRTYAAIYPENTKLYGLSLAKNIEGVSVGAELVYREKTALASTISDGAREGARGNTWHGLVNAVTLFGQTGMFDSASLTAELAFSSLDKVTSGQQYFNGCVRPGLPERDKRTGCATTSSAQGTIRFSPTWTAVRVGWDVGATAAVTVGLKGNSAVLGGGNYKAGSYTIGATLTYNQQHDFTIAYNDYLATRRTDPVTGLISASNGSQLQDRGWITFGYKGSF
ncbi:DUF1302 domain-containing protein [Massilia niastensis]|uniref:DUF1302 domain-containing protein n=1 Tax=Massilia niastensis TaxID=544911 RepID=UPI00036DA468|nr:DUF1302 family protein [Massilia niastensis]